MGAIRGTVMSYNFSVTPFKSSQAPATLDIGLERFTIQVESTAEKAGFQISGQTIVFYHDSASEEKSFLALLQSAVHYVSVQQGVEIRVPNLCD
jgi:hypothetical protein